MQFLVIETAAAPAFAAVVLAGPAGLSVVALEQISQPRALARDLIGAVDTVLAAAGWAPRQLDAVVGGTGPGSWTSLRVGLSTAKTLAQTLERPLVGVPYFAALASAIGARTASPGGPATLLLLSPCRPGEFYGAIYLLGLETFTETVAPAINSLDQWLAQAQSAPGPLYLAGESAPLAAAQVGELAGAEGMGAVEVAVVSLAEHALGLARLAWERVASGSRDNPLSLVPLYLAPSNAERNLVAHS